MKRRIRRSSSFEIGAAGLQSEIRHASFSIISKLFGEGTVGGMSAVSLVLARAYRFLGARLWTDTYKKTAGRAS